jgi:hypothetical protein
MTMDIPLILDHIRPGSEWGWLGEDKSSYDHLDWRDSTQEKPTREEVEAAWETVSQALDDAAVRQATCDEAIGRLHALDADALQEMAEGVVTTAEMAAAIGAIGKAVADLVRVIQTTTGV